jgi:hypothetical protein
MAGMVRPGGWARGLRERRAISSRLRRWPLARRLNIDGVQLESTVGGHERICRIGELGAAALPTSKISAIPLSARTPLWA